MATAFQADAFQNDTTGVLIKGFQVDASTPVVSPPSGGGGIRTMTQPQYSDRYLEYLNELECKRKKRKRNNNLIITL